MAADRQGRTGSLAATARLESNWAFLAEQRFRGSPPPRFLLPDWAGVSNNVTRGIDEEIDPVTTSRQGLFNWHTRTWTLGFAATVLALAFGNVCGQEPNWKTGAALRKQLETPLSLTWGDRELRGALESLGKSTGVAIFLDRRIDPNRKLTLSAADEPLRTLLLRVAEQADAGVALVGSVVYVGPKATASKLLALAALRRQEAGKLSAELRIRLGKSESWSWSELAEPRQLLAELAERGGVRVANPELIPHDLWPAVSWPAMPWTERMTLLLAGFDLTYETAGAGVIRLIPLPKEVVFEKTYTPRGDADRVAADLRRTVPAAKISVEGRTLRISAAAEDHERIDRLLRGESVTTTKVTPGQKRYTLTVENKPAGAVLKTIATQLGKELKYDPTLAGKLQTEVSLKVKEVPLEDLLDKTLGPLGLTYRLTEKNIEIVAAQ